MSNAYESMDFDKLVDEGLFTIDFRSVQGTRCYLDDEAKKLVKYGIADTCLEGVHFIDSGNYHYLSLLYLMRIQKKFDLLLVDNHPDMKSPSFGNITSCGGWVLEAMETLPNLGSVYMIGVKQELIDELEPLPKQIKVIKSIDEIEAGDALYLSIDKDALCEKYAVTDWDQGGMTLDYLVDIINGVIKKRQIIGADICGDTSEPTELSNSINLTTNKALLDCLTEAF